MNKQQIKREHGQSLTEVAVSFIVILTLLAGTVDFGRAFFAWIALRDAAQEGAVYASLNPTDSTGIISRVRQSSSNPVNLTDTTNVTVTCAINAGDATCTSSNTSACSNGARKVTVTVNYSLPLTMPFISAIISSNTIPLSGVVTNTILQPQC